MGNGMNKVLPGLYIGNYHDSKDADQLERFEITHILAIHDTARRLHSDKHYLCILAADSPDQNLSQYFSLCNDFIHAARLRGGNVLIHCLAGMSRSVTVAVAYIMSTTNLSWKEALKVVRVGRSIANPNVGFQQQLKDFESSRLHEERRRLKERFPSLALAESDAEVCRTTLRNYETMALAREVCEGKCAMGRPCPTGLCRQSSKRSPRRKSSTGSTSSLNTGRTPPQTPRMLPSAPPSPAMHRSASVLSTARPRSGPAGLHYYTGGSAPPSRAVSRVDLSAAVACSSSSTSLTSVGRSGMSSSNWRLAAGSAPNTPRPTPPVSPQRWPRRASTRQTPPLPISPETPSTTTVEEIRTDTKPLLGKKRRGSAGLQPTKTSTMTVSAAIERGPGTGARHTGPPSAQSTTPTGAVCGHVTPRLPAGVAVLGSPVPLPDRLATPRLPE